jgi:hypothetical protein
MDSKLHIIDPEELMPQLPQLLQEAESIPLVISGNSMAPFLRHGRDIVYLSKVSEPLKRGDMILYRRCNGNYILHRIYKETCGTYQLVGDGQWGLEPGIRPEQILAVVTAVRRKGKLLDKGSFLWEFFEHIWLAFLPMRPAICRLHGRLTAWRRKK